MDRLEQAIDNLSHDLLMAKNQGKLHYDLTPGGTFYRDIETVLEELKDRRQEDYREQQRQYEPGREVWFGLTEELPLD